MPQTSIDVLLDNDPVLVLDEIAKKYGTLAVLRGLSLTVNRGEVYGFLGRNGAGKSTAIRIMMGITKADSGSLKLFDQPVHSNVTRLRQRIGYVAQEQNFYRWMTPVMLGRFVKGFYPRWGAERFDRLIKVFELPPDRKSGTFSGGMKARLALSIALATNPELLILDEPTAGMDPVARREFIDLVRTEAIQAGATVFFSTHLIDDIEAVADRINIIDTGKTLYEGALHPLTDSIRSFSISLEAPEIQQISPGEFMSGPVRQLQSRDQQGRHVVTVQFLEDVLADPVLTEGWRPEPMTLEDIFVAVVSAG